MSQNFSAHQYESGYKPKCLGQWEVPKKFREHPPSREGYTFPLTDESGHFVDQENRPIFKEWSSFVGTWGKDFSRPKAIHADEVKPGVWLIKGSRARWVDASVKSYRG